MPATPPAAEPGTPAARQPAAPPAAQALVVSSPGVVALQQQARPVPGPG